MSNFHILTEGPIASPGVCTICGYPGSDRRYIDPLLSFEFYGSVIICELCIGAMASDMGFLQPAQARVLETRVEEAERELITLRSAVIQLESVHELLAGLGNNSGGGNSSNGDVGVLNGSDQHEPIEGAVGGTKPVNSSTGDGNQEIDDDHRVEGSDDLSDLISSADALLKL